MKLKVKLKVNVNYVKLNVGLLTNLSKVGGSAVQTHLTIV